MLNRLTVLLVILIPSIASAQQGTFDPSWYDATAPYVKIGVVEDGIYQLTAADLNPVGVPTDQIDPQTLRLFENGTEIPIDVVASGPTLQPTDSFYFVGLANTGIDENQLYRNLSDQSSDELSLFTDTTYYWLTWGGQPGLRYTVENTGSPTASLVESAKQTVHIETDEFYYPGQGSDVGNPIYTRGEGFYMSEIRHGTAQNVLQQEYTLPIQNVLTNGTDSIDVVVQVNSQTVSRHIATLEAKLGTQSTFTLLDSKDWIGATLVTFSGRIAVGNTPQTELNVRVTSRNDFGGSVSNSIAVDYVEATATVDLVASENQLDFLTDVTGTRNVAVSGFGGSQIRAYNQTRQTLTVAPLSSGESTYTAIFDAPTEFRVTSEQGVKTPVAIRPDASSNLADQTNAYDYVIISSDALLNSAHELASYRASAAGGNHSVLVARVQDVFDQFDYGRPTPTAIRRFVRNAQSWDVPMEFLTLWGDALYPDRTRPRANWEVPSFGHTVSDGWFSMQNASAIDYSEIIATGRIPIRSNEQGSIFVNKLMTYEGGEGDRWQKNAIYIVGGLTTGERNRLQSAAINWGSLVSSPPNLMDTLNFFKTSSDVLDPTFKDSLQNAFSEGASWLTYFGHSATQTWEIVTDPPATYDNAARLPIVLSLGCFTGDFGGGDGLAGDPLAFSEQLVIESLNGSIAHWGASSSGTITASEKLADEVHTSVFSDTVRVLGKALQQAKARYNDIYSDPLSVIHLLQYGLIGDPATRIALPSKPDLFVDASDINFSLIAPSTEDESFDAEIFIQNIGLFASDSVTVSISVTGPEGYIFASQQRIRSPLRDTTITFTIALVDEMIGSNSLSVVVDSDDEIEEMSELNNSADRSFVVFSSGVALVSPDEFSLVPEGIDPVLTMSSSSQSSTRLPIRMQIDTSATFTSPLLQETIFTPTGVVASWQPGGLQQNTVYHWRGRIDTPEQQDVWKAGSFVIKSGATQWGWHQQDEQFDPDPKSNGLSHSKASGWRFSEFELDVTMSSERGSGDFKGQIVVSGTTYERRGRGFGVLVLDGATGTVKYVESIVTYPSSLDDPVVEDAELQQLIGIVENGDYVFTRTRHLSNDNGEIIIPQEVKNAFASFGSSAIDTLDYSHLWIMKSRVGFPAEVQEFVDPSNSGNNEITESFQIPFSSGAGTVTSVLIENVSRWSDLEWAESLTAPADISVEVLDADDNRVAGPFQDPGTYPLTQLNSLGLSSAKLRATLTDPGNTQTPQLDSWSVTYDGFADLALDPAKLSLPGDTLVEPEPITFSFPVFNLAPFTADSAIVTVSLSDPTNTTRVIKVDTLLNLVDSANVEITYPSIGLTGNNLLRIDVLHPQGNDRVSFNNTIVESFVVVSDAEPPTFEVLVDGVMLPHNPDPLVNLQDPLLPFVSGHPVFEISVTDDNLFAVLASDTNAAEIFLDDERIPRTHLTFVDTGEDNVIQIRYEPDFSGETATHTLLVRIRDVAGNEAVGSPYQLHFRVQTQLEVERPYPYPNPMSTSTQFAFRLLGADAGEISDLHLRLYTLTGKVIRDFDLVNNPESLKSGALKIGWNFVQWDGTDSDGDNVATGVYLYRLFASGIDLQSGSATAVEKIAVIR